MSRHPKRKPRDVQQFLTRVIELLKTVGAVETDSTYRFTLDTKAGRLALHPDQNETTGLGTIFTRFDDPQRAVAILGQSVNPYSGKWNHHYFDGWTVETALLGVNPRLETASYSAGCGQAVSRNTGIRLARPPCSLIILSWV